MKNKLCLIVLLVLSILLTFTITKKITKERYEQSEIESLYVFGEKVSIESKKKVYRIVMDSAKIEYKNGGCTPLPISITFKNGGDAKGGLISSNKDGSKIIYGFYSIYKYKNGKDMTDNIELDDKQTSKKINHIEDYDAYIEVNFDKQLEVAPECASVITESEQIENMN